jgi:hypothetical protein
MKHMAFNLSTADQDTKELEEEECSHEELEQFKASLSMPLGKRKR